MLATILGKQHVDYESKKTGKQVSGISLFYSAAKKGVTGLCADSLWLPKGTPLYEQWEAFNLSFPVEADIKFEMEPGSRYPTLSNIDLFKAS